LADPVTRYVPSLAGSAYDGVSVRDVLMMASGVGWNEPIRTRRRTAGGFSKRRSRSSREAL
jgi:CubicO group peptidase (beta-lactamase class C family)